MQLRQANAQSRSKAVGKAIILLGFVGFIYSDAVVSWHRPALLFLLSILIAFTDYFPIQVSQWTVSVSLPMVYTVAAVSGFPSAAIVVAAVGIIVERLRRKPIFDSLVGICSRICGLLAAWAGTSLLLIPHAEGPKGLQYWELHLALSLGFIVLVSNLLMYFYAYSNHNGRTHLGLILSLSSSKIAGSFLYDTLMFWLASNPRNTGSGNLGTVFFFLPLVGGTVVTHLMTNLIRTKSGLEKVMELSQAMNRHASDDAVPRKIIEAALQLIEADSYSLHVLNDDGLLIPETEGGASVTELRFVHTAFMEKVVASSRTTLISNLPKELANTWNRHSLVTLKSVLMAPIRADGQVTGVLTLGRRNPRAFRPYEKRVLTMFAGHAGVAMNNARYIDEREKRLLVEERNRLAREIHDGIAQDLAGVLLQVEALRRTNGLRGEGILEEIRMRLTQTVSTVRASIFELRPEPYLHVGLVRALVDHVRDIQLKHSLDIQFDVDSAEFSMVPPLISQTIYSTTVECIQNVIKHAHATAVSLRLLRMPEVVRLTICDNGDGFHFGQAVMEASQRQSFGIENLYRMANEVGATLEFEASPGHGTTVFLEVPWREKA